MQFRLKSSPALYRSDESVLIGAPSGSGTIVAAEFALCRHFLSKPAAPSSLLVPSWWSLCLGSCSLAGSFQWHGASSDFPDWLVTLRLTWRFLKLLPWSLPIHVTGTCWLVVGSSGRLFKVSPLSLQTCCIIWVVRILGHSTKLFLSRTRFISTQLEESVEVELELSPFRNV